MMNVDSESISATIRARPRATLAVVTVTPGYTCGLNGDW